MKKRKTEKEKKRTEKNTRKCFTNLHLLCLNEKKNSYKLMETFLCFKTIN